MDPERQMDLLGLDGPLRSRVGRVAEHLLAHVPHYPGTPSDAVTDAVGILEAADFDSLVIDLRARQVERPALFGELR